MAITLDAFRAFAASRMDDEGTVNVGNEEKTTLSRTRFADGRPLASREIVAVETAQDNIYIRSQLLTGIRDALGGENNDFFREVQANLFGIRPGEGRADVAVASKPLTLREVRVVLTGLQAQEARMLRERQMATAKTAREEVGALLARTLPKSERGKLGIPEGEASPELLERLIAAAGAGDGKLCEIDLVLVRALWLTRETEGMDFDAFKAALPEKFGQIAGLKDLISAGATSRQMLDSVGKTLEKVSHGLGGTKDLLQICRRMATSDDRYMADAALTKRTRNLLGGYSFTGAQAMTGGAHAVCAALNAAARRKPLLGSSEEKLQAGQAASQAAMQEVARQGVRKADAAGAAEAIAADGGHAAHLDVLKTIRDEKTVAKVLAGKTTIRGGQLATALFALDTVFAGADAADSADGWKKAQSLVRGLKFSTHAILFTEREDPIDLENVDKSEKKDSPEGAWFRSQVNAMCAATNYGDWASAMESIRRKFDDLKLLDKAQTVLYFKDFGKLMSAESVRHELARVLGESKVWTDEQKALATRVTDRILMPTGGAAKREAALDALGEDRQTATAAQRKAVDDVARKMSRQINKTVDKAVDLVVCACFLDLGESASLKDLLEARDAVGDVQKWDFHEACMGRLDRMESLDSEVRDLAKVALVKRLMDMNAETFTELNDHVRLDPLLRLREFMVERSTHEEVRDVMTLDRFTRAVDGMLQMIDGQGAYVTLSTEASANVVVPVLETKAVNVELSLGVARRNGLTLHKDGQGYCLRLMRTGSAGVGVTIGGLLDALEVEASVSTGLLEGCELRFASADRCRDFVGALLAGQIQKESLVLCDAISTVRGGQVEGHVKLSAELDVLGVFSKEDEGEDDEGASLTVVTSVGLGGGVAWETTVNADLTTRARTVAGEFTYDISAGDNLSFARTLRFEEMQRVTTNTSTGELKTLSRTRVFMVDSEEAATAALRKMRMPEGTISEVCQEIKKGGEFKLEVESGLDAAKVLKPREVRLTREANAASIAHGVHLGDHLSLSRTTGGEIAEVKTFGLQLEG